MTFGDSIPFLLLAAVAGALSYGCLFDRDAWWRLQEHAYRTRGIITAQRTEEWEQSTRRIGYLFAGLALFLLLASVVSLTEPTFEERLSGIQMPSPAPVEPIQPDIEYR